MGVAAWRPLCYNLPVTNQPGQRPDPAMNLDHFVVISNDGTFMGANTCYLLDTRKLTPEQLDTLNEGCDDERADLAEELGHALEDLVEV